MGDVGRLTWIAMRSPEAVQNGLAIFAPALAGLDVRLVDRVVTDDPEYFQGSAVLGERYVVKFAWAEAPARRMVHEAGVLSVLAACDEPLPVPQLIASSSDPAMLVTFLVPGDPLVDPDQLEPSRRNRLADDLGRFLAHLHRPDTLHSAVVAGVEAHPPEPQGDTTILRERFPRLVSDRQADEVRRF